MDVSISSRRVLIVTPNCLVGADLKEQMLEYQGVDVDLHTSFDDAWGVNFALGFFGVSLDVLTADPRILAMREMKASLIIINGHVPAEDLKAANVALLAQPFRSQDVRDLLSELNFPIHP